MPRITITIDLSLATIIGRATKRTGLSRSELVRTALRKGIPLVKRVRTNRGRTLIDALLELKGLEIPERYYPMRRRY